MIQSHLITSLLGMISKPAMIRLDIEDLENFFKKGPMFSFAMSEKEGKDRALTATKEAVFSLKIPKH